jgi:hypothetical protein
MDDDKRRQKMTAFARTFPSIRNAAGVEPWDALKLDAWVSGPSSHGERVTVQFVLAVCKLLCAPRLPKVTTEGSPYRRFSHGWGSDPESRRTMNMTPTASDSPSSRA